MAPSGPWPGGGARDRRPPSVRLCLLHWIIYDSSCFYNQEPFTHLVSTNWSEVWKPNIGLCVHLWWISAGYLPGGFIIFGPRIRTYSQHQPLFRLVSHISLDCYSLFRPLHNGLYQRLCKGTNEYWSLFLQLIQNVFSSGRVAELANALLKIFTSASLICRLLYIFPSSNAFSPARFHQQIAFFNRQLKTLTFSQWLMLSRL